MQISSTSTFLLHFILSSYYWYAQFHTPTNCVFQANQIWPEDHFKPESPYVEEDNQDAQIWNPVHSFIYFLCQLDNLCAEKKRRTSWQFTGHQGARMWWDSPAQPDTTINSEWYNIWMSRTSIWRARRCTCPWGTSKRLVEQYDL